MSEEIIDEKKDETKRHDLRTPVKVIASTATGAGVGVLGAVAGIAVATVCGEVVLPVALCLWAGGITFGALGLILGLGKKKKFRD